MNPHTGLCWVPVWFYLVSFDPMIKVLEPPGPNFCVFLVEILQSVVEIPQKAAGVLLKQLPHSSGHTWLKAITWLAPETPGIASSLALISPLPLFPPSPEPHCWVRFYTNLCACVWSIANVLSAPILGGILIRECGEESFQNKRQCNVILGQTPPTINPQTQQAKDIPWTLPKTYNGLKCGTTEK